MEIKELLVLIRAKLNLSQEALARDLNVSFTTINRWELGKTKPSRRYVALIEEYCKEKGVSCNEKISLIDTALRRRFEFVEVTPNSGLIEDESLRKVLDTLNANLVDQLESTDLLIGHAYFIDKTIDDLPRIMNCSIIPLLYEYFYDNAKKVKEQVKKAIDGTGFVIIDSKVGRIQVGEKPIEV